MQIRGTRADLPYHLAPRRGAPGETRSRPCRKRLTAFLAPQNRPMPPGGARPVSQIVEMPTGIRAGVNAAQSDRSGYVLRPMSALTSGSGPKGIRYPGSDLGFYLFIRVGTCPHVRSQQLPDLDVRPDADIPLGIL